jgi:hypothetical protein
VIATIAINPKPIKSGPRSMILSSLADRPRARPFRRAAHGRFFQCIDAVSPM